MQNTKVSYAQILTVLKVMANNGNKYKKKGNNCSERGINKVLREFRSMRHKCLQTKSGQASVQSGVYACCWE